MQGIVCLLLNGQNKDRGFKGLRPSHLQLNLNDIPPHGSTSQNTGGATDDIGALFNDAYTAVQNMGEGSTTTKYRSPSTSIVEVTSDVEEHVSPVKVSSLHPNLRRTKLRTTPWAVPHINRMEGNYYVVFRMQNIILFIVLRCCWPKF